MAGPPSDDLDCSLLCWRSWRYHDDRQCTAAATAARAHCAADPTWSARVDATVLRSTMTAASCGRVTVPQEYSANVAVHQVVSWQDTVICTWPGFSNADTGRGPSPTNTVRLQDKCACTTGVLTPIKMHLPAAGVTRRPSSWPPLYTQRDEVEHHGLALPSRPAAGRKAYLVPQAWPV